MIIRPLNKLALPSGAKNPLSWPQYIGPGYSRSCCVLSTGY